MAPRAKVAGSIVANPKVRIVKLDDLKPSPYNPRTIDDRSLAALEKSLQRFGIVEPIIQNERNGHVVGGHQRLKLLKKAKVKETAVVIVDLPDSEEQALNVTLNSPQHSGKFEPSRLSAVLDSIKLGSSELFGSLDLDMLKIAAPDRHDEVPVKKERLPEIVWVLVGCPVEKYGQISDHIAAIEAVATITVQVSREVEKN